MNTIRIWPGLPAEFRALHELNEPLNAAPEDRTPLFGAAPGRVAELVLVSAAWPCGRVLSINGAACGIRKRQRSTWANRQPGWRSFNSSTRSETTATFPACPFKNSIRRTPNPSSDSARPAR